MPERFVILADVHLGLVGPQPDGNTYGEVDFLLDRAVEKIRAIDPRQVILLGDLVNRGFDAEYRLAREALSPVIERCLPVLGNHELQRGSIADFERNMQTRAVRTETICGLPAIILNSGIENLPDTEWGGAVDDGQLRLVGDVIVGAAKDRPLAVVVHHPIAGTVRRSDEAMFGLSNSQELQGRLERHDGPVIVLSAHTHMQSFVRRGRFAYFGAPAVGFWPHAITVFEREGDELQFSTIRLLDDPAESPDAGTARADYRAASEGGPDDQSGVIDLAS